MIHPLGAEVTLERQADMLHTPVGAQGSGAARYAAAMFFYNERAMSIEMLEIYRSCSKFDHEDPLDMARHKGIEIPPISLSRSGA